MTISEHLHQPGAAHVHPGHPKPGHDAPYPGVYPNGVVESSHAFGPYLYRRDELLLRGTSQEQLKRQFGLLSKRLSDPELQRRLLADVLAYRLLGDYPRDEHARRGVGRVVDGLSDVGGLLGVAAHGALNLTRLPLQVEDSGERYGERDRDRGTVALLRLKPIAGVPDLVPVLVQRLRSIASERGEEPPLDVSPNHVLWGCAHGISYSASPPASAGTAHLTDLPTAPGMDPVTIALVDNGVADVPWFGARGTWVDDLPAGSAAPAQVSGTLPAYTGHGTFTAGLALDQARAAVEGGRSVRLVSVTMYGPDGMFSDTVASDALNRLCDAVAGSPPAVLLLPWGGPVHPNGGALPAVEGALARFAALNPPPVVVAAAGNDTTGQIYPAASTLPQVVGVGCGRLTDHEGTPPLVPATFSNTAIWIKVWADGQDVVGPFPSSPAPVDVTDVYGGPSLGQQTFDRGWAVWSGTSMSAALVAGAVAREVAATGATPADAWTAVRTRATQLGTQGVFVPTPQTVLP